jgi:hypothetical protein
MGDFSNAYNSNLQTFLLAANTAVLYPVFLRHKLSEDKVTWATE